MLLAVLHGGFGDLVRVLCYDAEHACCADNDAYEGEFHPTYGFGSLGGRELDGAGGGLVATFEKLRGAIGVGDGPSLGSRGAEEPCMWLS